jgi:WXG100 family type VII secretion target
MTRSFQIETEQLGAVIDHFSQQAQTIEAIITLLADRQAGLKSSGWGAAGSEHFFTQMDQDVLPQLDKLRDALASAGVALQRLNEQLQQMKPALDQIQQGMPQIQAAAEKLRAQIEKLQNQNPEEVAHKVQEMMENQHHE